MALNYADRVLETSTTTGTGTLDLAGAKTGGYQTFVAGIGDTNTCYYCIENPSADEWEVGLGTITDAATDTLARTTVIASSNADAAVNFSAGTKNVFAVLPAMVSGTEQIKLSAILNAGGFKLTNVADPASAQDAATRSWTLAQISAHELVTDLTPQLGGDLDVNDNAIVSTNGGDVVFTADAPGNFIFNNGDITADWSSAPGSRIALKSSTTNGISAVTITPNGTGTEAYIVMEDNSTVGNNQFVSLGLNATAASINSSKRGTGTAVPFQIIMDGSPVLEVETDFTLNVANVTNYENLVTADDDIPNRKWVTDQGYVTSAGISNVVEDTTPQLGGTLDSNGFAGNFDAASAEIPLTTNVTGGFGDTIHPSFMLAASKGSNMGNGFGVNMLYQIQDDTSGLNTIAEIRAVRTDHDNSGTLKFVIYSEGNAKDSLNIERNGTLNVANVSNYENLVTADDDIPNRKWVTDQAYLQAADLTGYLQNIVEDTTPQLGANLDTQGFEIKTENSVSGNADDITVRLGNSTTDDGGSFTVFGGNGTTGVNAAGGNIQIQAGSCFTPATGGPGDVILTAGAGNASTGGGDITITAGDNSSASAAAGNITLDPGTCSGSGSNGYVVIKGTSGATGIRHLSAAGALWTVGAGTPEGSVVAPIGSLYTRTDGGTDTTLYVKETGTGNTGWVANAAGGGGISNVVEDTTPELGGDLDMAGNDIYEDANPGTQGSSLGKFIGRWNTLDVAYMEFQSGSDTVSKDAGQIAFYTQEQGGSGGIKLLIDEFGRLITGGSDCLRTTNADGSLTVSSGDSGVTLPFTGPLVVENSGNGGVCINTPDASIGQVMFGSPTDPSGAAIRWEYGTAGATKELEVATRTSGGELVLCSDAVQRRLLIDATGRIITNVNAPQNVDVLGAEGGSVTISTGNSTVTSALPGADDLIIENSGNAGISILTPNTLNGYICFGDPQDNNAGQIVYDHTNDKMRFNTNGALAATIDSTGRLLTGSTASDAVGAEAGSVTISTGNSGATTAQVWADDLLIENDNDAGLTIFTPNTKVGSIYFGDPEDNDAGRISYDHVDNEMDFYTAGSTTAGIRITDSGKLIVGAVDTDATGWSTHSGIAISTSNSGCSTNISTKADELVLEALDGVGMTFCSPASGGGAGASINFADPGDADVGQIHYNHINNQLTFRTNGVNRLYIESDGTLSVLTTNYENLVTADDDIPNKKYVDDKVASTFIYETDTSDRSVTNAAPWKSTGQTVTIPTTGIISLRSIVGRFDSASGYSFAAYLGVDVNGTTYPFGQMGKNGAVSIDWTYLSPAAAGQYVLLDGNWPVNMYANHQQGANSMSIDIAKSGMATGSQTLKLVVFNRASLGTGTVKGTVVTTRACLEIVDLT